MIHNTRKFLAWLFGKFIPYEYIFEAANQQLTTRNRSKAKIAQTSVLAETATISNFQDNPDKISIGPDSVIRGDLLIFKFGGQISIGSNCYIGSQTTIWSGEAVSIGDHVLISHQVNISDTSAHEPHHIARAEGFKNLKSIGHPETKGTINTAPIIIEDYAWINPYVVILKGVKIGTGAIVGAGSVVTQNVAPFTFVAGNPAKFIKNVEHD